MEVYDYSVTSKGEVKGHCFSAYANLEGTITSDEFGARFCGVPVGTYDNLQNAGKKSSHHFMVYMYEVADEILNGKSYFSHWEYELLPEYEPREIRFISSIDNKECVTHGIFAKEEQQ